MVVSAWAMVVTAWVATDKATAWVATDKATATKVWAMITSWILTVTVTLTSTIKLGNNKIKPKVVNPRPSIWDRLLYRMPNQQLALQGIHKPIFKATNKPVSEAIHRWISEATHKRISEAIHKLTLEVTPTLELTKALQLKLLTSEPVHQTAVSVTEAQPANNTPTTESAH